MLPPVRWLLLVVHRVGSVGDAQEKMLSRCCRTAASSGARTTLQRRSRDAPVSQHLSAAGSPVAMGTSSWCAVRAASSGVQDFLDEKEPEKPVDPASLEGRVDVSPEAVKRALVQALMAKDREVLDLKRIHELSLHRVEKTQEKHVKEHEEKAVFYEDNVNKQVLETVEVTEHEFDNVRGHRDMAANMRYMIMFANVAVTILTCRWLYRWYAYDPKRHYVSVWSRIQGSSKNYKEMQRQALETKTVQKLGSFTATKM